MDVTNHSREMLSFRLRGGKADSLEPGETRDIDIDPDSAQNRARATTGLITVAGGRQEPTRPKAPARQRRSAAVVSEEKGE